MSQWFQKRLGLAMGIALAGLGAGGFTVPLIVFLLDSFSWRNTFIIIGVAGFILGIVLLVFLRNKPRDIGSTLDGLPEDELQSTSTTTHGSNNTSGAPYHDFSLREALSNRSFWIVAYMGLAGIFSTNMITTHVMPYLEDIGYVRSLAGIVAMMIPVMSIVGRLGVGWASDFISSKTIWLGVIACQVVGVIFFINAHLSFVLIPFVIIYGIGYGGNVVISLRILRSYFGKGQIGSITGASLAISIMGAFVSPWLAGFVFDTMGSYNIAWIINIALLIMGVPLVLSLKNP